jgi:hypothetical protein
MPNTDSFIEVNLINWEELEAKFKNSREYILGAGLTSLRRIGDMLVPALKEKTPVGATGHLRNYTVYEVIGTTEDMRLEVRQSAYSQDGYYYGVAVRGGTRPHFPPVRALLPWVIKKFGIGEEKQALKIAWAIAVKISKVGTKAQPYHIHVVEETRQSMIDIVYEEMEKLTARFEQ